MQNDTIIRTLPVKLTTDEILFFGRENARVSSDIDLLEQQRKAANDDFKAKIGTLSGEIAHRNACINSGYEDRKVECREEIDHHLGKVRIIRQDTFEVVSVRPMTTDEYQTVLDMRDSQ